MTQLKRAVCFLCLLAAMVSANQANAWHGPGGFGYGGYGFGLNHHSFRPSIYNPGWGGYSRASVYYGGFGHSGFGYSNIGYSHYRYGGLGYWPRASYHVSYRSYAPVFYNSYLPAAYYNSYYPPAYCYPNYSTYYAPVVAPVIYSPYSVGFPTCSVTPSIQTGVALTTYAVKKPVTSGVPLRLASQPLNGQLNVPSANQATPSDVGGRFVATDSTGVATKNLVTMSAANGGNNGAAPIQVTNAVLDSAPVELMAAADAILSAGGYRQAAQAYAQLVVKYGNSDRLVTRRFIAQVANGDYEQAAVVVELAMANGNRIERADLPQGDLKLAIGDSGRLIGERVEGLAANALAQADDAVPMLTVAHWLALNGDDDKANLFKARAEQMQQTDVAILVHKPLSVDSSATK